MNLKVIIPVTELDGAELAEISKYISKWIEPDTTIAYEILGHGFPSVESEVQGMFNGTEIVQSVVKSEAYQGVFVNCFDDPGVYASRELTNIPVIGAYQPAIFTALALGDRVGIVTTDVPGILSEERKARAEGIENRISVIRRLDMEVFDIRKHREEVLQKLEELSIDMYTNDRVTSICLGCTAMYSVVEELRERLAAKKCPVNIIEPMANAIRFLENMVRLGYTTKVPTNIDFSELVWGQ